MWAVLSGLGKIPVPACRTALPVMLRTWRYREVKMLIAVTASVQWSWDKQPGQLAPAPGFRTRGFSCFHETS